MAVTVDLLAPERRRRGNRDLRCSRSTGSTRSSCSACASRTPIAPPAAEADALVDLLSAHAATDRVAFVPQGTPTNNVDGRASGWTSAPDIFAAYERVVAPGCRPAPRPRPASTRCAVAPTTRRRPRPRSASRPTRSSGSTTRTRSSSGRRARWRGRCSPSPSARCSAPSRGRRLASGDEVEHLLDRLDDLIPFASEHMASFVRSRGPLPVLRVGRQPYGLLPILPLDRWVPRANEPAELPNLVNVLGVLRPFWEHAAGGIGRFSGGAVDLTNATDQLVRILGLGAVPHPGAYQVRDVTGQIGSIRVLAGASDCFVQDATPTRAHARPRARRGERRRAADRVPRAARDDAARSRARLALRSDAAPGHKAAPRQRGAQRSEPRRLGDGSQLPEPAHRDLRPRARPVADRRRRPTPTQAHRPAVRARRARDGAVGRARLAAPAPLRLEGSGHHGGEHVARGVAQRPERRRARLRRALLADRAGAPRGGSTGERGAGGRERVRGGRRSRPVRPGARGVPDPAHPPRRLPGNP